MEFNDGHALTLSHSPHRIRVVEVSLLYLAMGSLIEAATLSGSNKNNIGSCCPHAVDESFQSAGEVIPSTITGSFLLLVIMSELTDHVVARLGHREHLVEAMSVKEGTNSQATLGMVRNSHLIREPAGNHLPPRSPGLQFLIHHGGVATEEYGSSRCIRFYSDGLNGRRRTIKFQCKQIVPVQIV